MKPNLVNTLIKWQKAMNIIDIKQMERNLEILLQSKIANKQQILRIQKLLARHKRKTEVVCYCYAEICKLNIRYKIEYQINYLPKPVKL